MISSLLKGTQGATGGRMAFEPLLTSGEKMCGRMITPPCIVLVMLEGKLNKGFWSSGKFLHSKLELRLKYLKKLFLLFCADEYFLK